MISLISVSSVVRGFNLQPIKAYRATEGVRDRGEYIPGAAYTLPISKANVQNGTSRDTSFLPEGQRTTSIISVFTNFALIGVSESSQTLADVIEWNGSFWRVAKVFNWNANGYNEAIATEVENYVRPI